MGQKDGIWDHPWNTIDDIYYILIKPELIVLQTKWNFVVVQ